MALDFTMSIKGKVENILPLNLFIHEEINKLAKIKKLVNFLKLEDHFQDSYIETKDINGYLKEINILLENSNSEELSKFLSDLRNLFNHALEHQVPIILRAD